MYLFNYSRSMGLEGMCPDVMRIQEGIAGLYMLHVVQPLYDKELVGPPDVHLEMFDVPLRQTG